MRLDDIFLPEKKADKYMRAADQRAGAYSVLTGAAANISFGSRAEVKVADLVHDAGYPDYPAMPTKKEAAPMPPRPEMRRPPGGPRSKPTPPA